MKNVTARCGDKELQQNRQSIFQLHKSLAQWFVSHVLVNADLSPQILRVRKIGQNSKIENTPAIEFGMINKSWPVVCIRRGETLAENARGATEKLRLTRD